MWFSQWPLHLYHATEVSTIKSAGIENVTFWKSTYSYLSLALVQFFILTVKCSHCQVCLSAFSSGGKLAHFCPLPAACYFVIKIRSKCAHSSMWESQTYHMRETTGNATTAIQSVSHIHPSSLLITAVAAVQFLQIFLVTHLDQNMLFFFSPHLFSFLLLCKASLNSIFCFSLRFQHMHTAPGWT